MKRTKLLSLAAITVILSVLLTGLPVYAGESTSQLTPYFNLDFKVPERKGVSTQYPMLQGAALPSSYSSVEKGYVTTPKNQGVNGTCWAFSAVSMAETSLLATGSSYGGGKTAEAGKINLSEKQLAYFSYQPAYDPMGNLTGDNVKLNGVSWYEIGGNPLPATFSLAAWVGLADEEVMPYGDNEPTGDTYSPELAAEASARIRDAYWFNLSDKTAVKTMIMKYGAVITGYYHDDVYYNSNTYGYYCPSDYTMNHATTIVGWDDSYSRNNFSTPAPGDGAWLVKNSWGSSWGNGGYNWISYYDAGMSDQDAATYVFTDSDSYDNNYQYDGTSAIMYMGAPSGSIFANTYEVKGADTQRLEAVSFALHSPDVKYSVQIYKSATDNPENITGGEALMSAPVTGKSTYTGYYTVDLSEEVILKRGDYYTVAVTVESIDGSDVLFFIDGSYDAGYVEYINDISRDRSLCGYYMNGRHYRMDITAQGATARIKGFTNNVFRIDYVLDGLSYEGESGYVPAGHSYTGKLIAEEGKPLPSDVTVTCGGAAYDAFSYDSSTGEINIDCVEGDIGISASAAASRQYSVSVDGKVTMYAEGDTVLLSVPAKYISENAGEGYVFDTWTVSGDAVAIDNPESSAASFVMPAGDVVITSKYYRYGDINGDRKISTVDVFQMKLVLKGARAPSKYSNLVGSTLSVNTQDMFRFKLLYKGLYDLNSWVNK